MKRLFVLLLSGVMLTSSVPMVTYAAMNETVTDAVPIANKEVGYTSNSSKSEPTNQALESAIKAVKAKITIPKEFSDFNYYFTNESSYSDSYWNLTWKNPSTSAYIQVNCDSDYHITFFGQYDYENKNTGISKYLKKELKATADKFIQKIAPETTNRLEYIDASFEGIYSGNYVYNYQRVENGIDFPDNNASVSVNSITGEVSSAYVNWLYDASIPASKTTLTLEEAAKLITDNMDMKLVYRSNYFGIYDKSGNMSKKAFLVYEPTQYYISVDAKTGKVYLERTQWVDTGSRNESGKAETAAEADGSFNDGTQMLTDEEIAKIEELKNLISKADAIKNVTSNPYLLIDKNLKVSSAELHKRDDNGGDTSYVWYINFNDPREIDSKKLTDSYRAYAYASVDAKTGKILSFYTSVKSYYDEATNQWNSVKIPYDKKEAKSVLESFLNSQMKDYFKNSVFTEQNDDYIAYYKNDLPVYGGYNYQYNRVNAGVEYPYNGIYGSVDGVTGKIYSVSYNWDTNITFESPTGAMSAKEAMVKYLSKKGFELKYEINVVNEYDSTKNQEKYDDYKTKYEVRLVYRPDVTPSYISPFTGEQLNYDGEVYKETKPYSYLDIADIPENRDILLLSDMNIGFEGDNFMPKSEITVGEINSLLEKIGYGYGYAEEETSNVAKTITREEIAQTFIKRLGFEKVSELQGIYKTGFNDESSIDSKYLGAVALAKGLGLMEADASNNFNPKSNISRFDAVNLILNFIKAQKNGVNY
jgi:hypothetical protein